MIVSTKSNAGKPLFVRIRNAKVGSSTLFTGTRRDRGQDHEGPDPFLFLRLRDGRCGPRGLVSPALTENRA